MSPAPHHFVFLLYPDVSLSGLTGAMEVFEQALLEQEMTGGALGWRITLASRDGGLVRSYFGVGLETRSLAQLEDEPIGTLFISGGLGYRAAMADDALTGWIARQAPLAGRICASGTGTFILATAGLLEGRKIVTHWLMNDAFSSQFPSIGLVRNQLYLKDGTIWTSAGMGSAVEFMLALLEQDAGRDFAFRIARRTAVMLRRSGDQPQISGVLEAQAREGDRFDRLHEWIHANLASDLSVEALAHHVGMSARNFSRIYRQQMGMTPAQAVMRIRLEAANEALLHSDARISSIAHACGFSDEQHLRRAFLRWIGKAPSELREQVQSH